MVSLWVAVTNDKYLGSVIETHVYLPGMWKMGMVATYLVKTNSFLPSVLSMIQKQGKSQSEMWGYTVNTVRAKAGISEWGLRKSGAADSRN